MHLSELVYLINAMRARAFQLTATEEGLFDKTNEQQIRRQPAFKDEKRFHLLGIPDRAPA
ncbi:hypothetical protein EYZ11_013001 [Aspergillus tanneri]|uniref:Uncharacterized protein n=1 Tax=Aspergillus tanneri TaxID=1220188 RepID=A0A4V3UMJ5_9EURO|nr:hypothetical protein EYZ11_013001 [Aspergillus tanneri]